MRPNNISGDRFGRLVALTPWGTKNRQVVWFCLCDCGATSLVGRSTLGRGNTSSCGCLKREMMQLGIQRNGGKRNPEYRSWQAMLARCLNPAAPQFANYGGRGIRVCQEWAASFDAFLDHVGPRPSMAHTIDRIDPHGHYQPGNVRWATAIVQNNNRTDNRILIVDGERLTLAQAARRANLPLKTVWSRLKAGLSVDEALSRPKRVWPSSIVHRAQVA